MAFQDYLPARGTLNWDTHERNMATAIQATTDSHQTQINTKASLTHTHTGGVGDVIVDRDVVTHTLHLTQRGVERRVSGALLQSLSPRGFISLSYVYAYSTQISILPGCIDLDGNMYCVGSAINITIPTLTASTWYYLHVLPTASSNNLTVSNFGYSAATAGLVTWNADKAGWYHPTSLWRVIGFFRTDAAGAVAPFSIDGGFLRLQDAVEFLSTSTPSTGGAAVTVPIPDIVNGVGVVATTTNISATSDLYIANASGSLADWTAVVVGCSGGIANPVPIGRRLVTANSSGRIAYKSTSGTSTVKIALSAIVLPRGVAR